ncbi:MAG: hypothetical protein M5U34_35370 [Chloroflexi bacterium]|nr:hypothetical protein [Chloroflexota bacterium]
MYLANYKEGPAGFVDGSWAWLDNGMTVAAANDGTPVPAVLKRTGHLSRMDNRVTTQTNGGYVVVQRSTYALAGQTIAVRVSGDLVEPTNNGLYYMYSDHPSASSGQALGSVERYPERWLDRRWSRRDTCLLATGARSRTTCRRTEAFTGHVHNNLGGGADDLGLIYEREILPARIGPVLPAPTPLCPTPPTRNP